MPEGQVLEFSGVTKRFGGVTAVDGFTARVEPGRVTGFLGPNGAGKTTTLRILLGLVRATEGSATIGGAPYAKLRDPLRTVGAVLEASSFHPGRTGANHLKVYAHAAGLPDARVDDVLGTVGLADVGGRKVGGYSLGMRQRLGLAYALLGDPGVLVLDEPANGLDPEGIKWMRGLLRELARQGRTVLVSSHLLAEVQQTVDSLVIISRGRLVFQGALGDLTDPSEYTTVVDSGDRRALVSALRTADIESEVLRSGFVVRGIEPGAVGAAAAAGGVALTLLQRRGPALEEIFLDLVNGTRVHASASGAVAGAVGSTALDAAAAAVPVDAGTVTDDGEDAPEADADAAVDTGAEAVADAETAGAEAAGETDAALEPAPEEAPDADGVSTSDPAGVDVAAAGPADQSTTPETEAEVATQPDAEPGEDGGGGEITEGPLAVSDSEETDTTRHPAYVVASTGIIDVVPGAAEAASETDADPTAGTETDPADAASEPAPVETGAHGVFSVGSTGETVETAAIKVVSDPTDGGPESDDVPETVGEAGEDRAWETYVKTDSDHDADRFFAAYSEGETGGDADRDPGDREEGEQR